jgi:molecular chaperone DnaK
MGGVMTKIIEKNTTIPTQASQVFSTAEDNQNTVTIHVLQGEREKAAANKSLGQFNLTDIPAAPRGTPQIEVTFDLDANGILSVSAKDKNTGLEQSIVIKASGGLSDEEIEKMVRDARDNAAEDRIFQEMVTLRNQADTLIHTVRSSMESLGESLNPGDKNTLDNLLAELEIDMKGTEAEKIRTKMQEVEGALNSIVRQHQEAGAQQGQSQGADSADPGPKSDADDDVVDAEFEEN